MGLTGALSPIATSVAHTCLAADLLVTEVQVVTDVATDVQMRQGGILGCIAAEAPTAEHEIAAVRNEPQERRIEDPDEQIDDRFHVARPA
jgi:hypothetical protein